MKRFKFLPFFLSICLLLGLALSPAALALDEPETASRAAVIMDRSTGEVFYSKNADHLVFPASTTKIMTVLLAIEAIEAEKVSIYDEVTATENMTYDLVADGSTAGIMVGETMTLENLLYCAMLSSANEACNIIGEYIAGTISAFVQMMNERADELGCSNTHFTNTHGLPDTNHYTTAEDFCRIAVEATSHDLFMDFCTTTEITIPATNMSGERHIKNSNALICGDSIYGSKYLYEYAAGVKTGFTSDAGYCLISTASKNNIDLLCAVYGGYSYTDAEGQASYTNFEDSIALYEWVFNNFSYQEILKSTETAISVPVSMGSDADSVNLRPETSLTALLPNDCDPSSFTRSIRIYSEDEKKELVAPISAGEVLGEISLSKDGVDYGSSKLVAAASVDLSRIQYMKTEITNTIHSKPVKTVFWVLVGLLFLYLVLVIRYRILYHRRKRAVRQARKAAQLQEQSHLHKPIEAKPVQSPPVSASKPTAPSAPPISYFSAAENAKPEAKPQPTPVSAPAPAQEPQPAERQAQAERDYFEEFFRQK